MFTVDTRRITGRIGVGLGTLAVSAAAIGVSATAASAQSANISVFSGKSVISKKPTPMSENYYYQYRSTVATSGLAISPNLLVGGGGSSDTYSIIEITPSEEETILAAGATGIGAMITLGCTLWWSGVGATACVGAIGAAGYTVITLIQHGQFPYIYVWWDDTTSSYAGTTVVW